MQGMSDSRVRRKAIAVCGAGTSDPALDEVALELGRLIVEKGYVLICGGMSGVMEAACRGGQAARRHGGEGLVVGILPVADLDGGNAFCDIVIPTGMGPARNTLVVLSADAVILVGGGSGTLSEAAYAWQFGKPLIALTSSGGWAKKLAGSSIDARRPGVVIAAYSPAEAVAAALNCMD
jgi:uncharacterized protein (TIGR00725 family)